MAKKSSIHDKYREITVEMTNGTHFKVRSTYEKSELRLDVDRYTHPAWTKQANYINTRADEVTKFNNKYGGISFDLSVGTTQDNTSKTSRENTETTSKKEHSNSSLKDNKQW